MSFVSTTFDNIMIDIVDAAATKCAGANNQRLVALIAYLEKIRTAVRAQDVNVAMTGFTLELLQLKVHHQRQSYPLAQSAITRTSNSLLLPGVAIFNSLREDEVLIYNLEYHGAAITTILSAMDKFLGRRGVSPEFFNNATIALVHLVFQSKDRCRALYQQGGATAIARMMQTYRSVDFIQVIGIAALMVLGTSILGANSELQLPTTTDLEAMILWQIVEAMEYHQGSSRIYNAACSAIGTLLGPGSRILVDGGELENYLYHRVLYAVTYGVSLHLDDPVAQGVGNALLSNMVGRDVAEEMVAEVERNHGGAVCAAAA